MVDVNVITQGSATLIRLRGSLKLGSGVEDLAKTFEMLYQQGRNKFVLSIADVPMTTSETWKHMPIVKAK